MKAKSFGWTLVQHSGYGYAEKPGFMQALEIRSLANRAERNLVERVGGVVFEDYGSARDAEEALNYPHEFKTPADIYPRFEGTFSPKMIDGLRIALPLNKEAMT